MFKKFTNYIPHHRILIKRKTLHVFMYFHYGEFRGTYKCVSVNSIFRETVKINITHRIMENVHSKYLQTIRNTIFETLYKNLCYAVSPAYLRH